MRWTSAILTALFALALAVPSCSEATKYRVLTFLFDGVPEPGMIPPKGYERLGGAVTILAAEEDGRRVAVRRPIYAHPPYREGKCEGCHIPGGGMPFRLPEEGLCRTCHRQVPGDAKYVHGPVAVDACTFCHHHHYSLHPRLLHEPVPALCLNCHMRADLMEGPHHEKIDDQPCTGCHDPHGGGDRFFLRQNPR